MTDNQPPTPVPAATIMMLRDAADGLEVFMVVRHHQIDFASGALVFPGGKTDAADFEPALEPYLDGAATDADMRALQVSAIREAFEECGILLARESEGTALITGERLATLESYRDRLNQQELTILDFVTQENLRLACDQLTYFAHWITPEMMPKRFDTHFFLAPAPADHLALHDGHESVDSVWIRPDEVLVDAKAGKRTVIFPTLRNVEKVGHFATVQAAIDATDGTTPVTVLPWTEQRDDGTYLCIPQEAGYDLSEERLPDRKPA